MVEGPSHPCTRVATNMTQSLGCIWWPPENVNVYDVACVNECGWASPMSRRICGGGGGGDGGGDGGGGGSGGSGGGNQLHVPTFCVTWMVPVQHVAVPTISFVSKRRMTRTSRPYSVEQCLAASAASVPCAAAGPTHVAKLSTAVLSGATYLKLPLSSGRGAAAGGAAARGGGNGGGDEDCLATPGCASATIAQLV